MLKALIKASYEIAKLPAKMAHDVATLGGSIDESYIKNGQRTNTGEHLRKMKVEFEKWIDK